MLQIFDCCKQSLTRLYHPPTHPPIHPVPYFFVRKRNICQITVYICSYYVQITRQVKTGFNFFKINSKFSTSNFTTQMLRIFNFELYITANLQFYYDFFQLFEITKFWYLFIKLTPLKIEFECKYAEIWTFEIRSFWLILIICV